MNTIIITGASGFSGSHVLEMLQMPPNHNYRTLAACRSKSKLPKWFKGEVMEGDLKDLTYLDLLTSKADTICHTAAWAELNGTDRDSKKNFFKPTINLIVRALKNGVKRFIFLSAINSNPIEQNKIHTKRPLNKVWPHYDSILKIEKHLQKAGNKGMEVVILRAGFFVGKNYSLGILPVLLPRLQTRLVPWIHNGSTSLPLVDGKDLGTAFKLAATVQLNSTFNIVDIVGKSTPTVREVFNYLHDKYNYSLPLFSVSFKFAYFFARCMQVIHRIVPGDPLIVPAIVLLLEETSASNEMAKRLLAYTPKIHWQESIDVQINEMNEKQKERMKLNKT